MKLFASKVEVQRDFGAVLNEIGSSANAARANAPAYLVAKGGTLQMEDVTFINCTFSMPRTEATQYLIAKSIGTNLVTVQVG